MPFSPFISYTHTHTHTQFPFFLSPTTWIYACFLSAFFLIIPSLNLTPSLSLLHTHTHIHTHTHTHTHIHTHTHTGSLKLIACLPDQLLIAYTALPKTKTPSLSDIISGTNLNENSVNSVSLNAKLNFSCRPCSSLESSVLGLVSMFENKEDLFSKRKDSNNERGLPQTDHFTAHLNTVKGSTFGSSIAHLEDAEEVQRNVLCLSALVTSMCAPRLTPGNNAMHYYILQYTV